MISRIAALVMNFALVTAAAIGTMNGQTQGKTRMLPLTSRSPEARRMVEEAMNLGLDKVQQTQAIEMLHRALKIDPEFAMAHEFLTQVSLDPGEQVSEQRKAFATRSHASHGEQLVIEWYQDVTEHKLMSAIIRMNDLLSRYPHDKWVVWMTTRWLSAQSQNERAIEVYERSGITNSPGLMNNIGYCYAYLRQFDKAFILMDKYVAALPHDPNPQDSYAEILRMAGHFEEAIEHYRGALAVDPEFYSSEFGIADTYLLMEKPGRARKEYEAAFRKFSLPELDRVLWQTREAITYVQEGDYEGADRSFVAITHYAHEKKMSHEEADTYRQMAMYQPDPKHALVLLHKAEQALHERKNTSPVATKQEEAQILRARVEVALKDGNKRTARSSLARLAEMAQSSNDKLIDIAYRGAAGAAAFDEGKYKEAIAYLEDDIRNPLSLERLAAAYQKTGNRADAQRAFETLANLNDPTLEQALVVPAFRTCYQDVSCNGNVKARR